MPTAPGRSARGGGAARSARIDGAPASIVRGVQGASMSDAETLNSERVYSGKVFNVDRDQVTMPNGRTVTVDVVRHSKSVVVAPVPAPGSVVLIRQYRHPVNRMLWELPAGS